ncbi:DUF4345 domain-containing protein [Psychromicrobium xiongbiense]|uniref:DUF4345 domain-containing protein n=1 Tax=Psychromicrobium xiongbiense TaxID=3051184 RepID=UPI0025565EA6|nr:DUF4345 domain-containing protein [Psychromicrobium sp. YIM S02556]
MTESDAVPAMEPEDSGAPEGETPEGEDTGGEDTGAEQPGAAKKEPPTSEWRLFRLVLAVFGLLLAGVGLFDLFSGISNLPDAGSSLNATIQSNYRFLAAFLVGTGISYLLIAFKFVWSKALMVLSSTVFLGGLARVYSWAVSGLPEVTVILLLIAELVLPPVIVVWYLWVERTQTLRARFLATGTLPG